MVSSSRLALCAAVTGATALQIPLFASNNQAPLVAGESKPLVNTTELQDLISGDRLMARAKKLYEIAKLGEAEYNHPTRVIGSAGRLYTYS
jgi:aminopeptidase Y